uniref:Apolipoprotein M n=1 Tax=Amphiprion percula TaxID=161767 RepID=A0A3P8SUR8_AMPPE
MTKKEYMSRMSVMKRAVLLLLLLLAVGSNADPTVDPTVAPTADHTAAPDPCHDLNNKIHLKDLHKLEGEWVLFWSVSDHDDGHSMLSNLKSSHVEIHADNETFIMTERNLYKTGPNRRDYFINETLVHNADDHDHHNIHSDNVRLEVDGQHEDYNDTADIIFYETCPECMLMTYNVKEYRFLLSYRKDGHHRDPEKVKTVHDDHKQHAECLKFPHDKPYSYDGVADFAHKKSAPPTEPPAPDAQTS